MCKSRTKCLAISPHAIRHHAVRESTVQKSAKNDTTRRRKEERKIREEKSMEGGAGGGIERVQLHMEHIIIAVQKAKYIQCLSVPQS